jgi:hypothetical protein
MLEAKLVFTGENGVKVPQLVCSSECEAAGHTFIVINPFIPGLAQNHLYRKLRICCQIFRLPADKIISILKEEGVGISGELAEFFQYQLMRAI